jgi:DNA-binding HxlR family transcriptional regulator
MTATSSVIGPTSDRRSGCPINLSLEVFGDRWSLIVIRDMMFGRRHHFRELLTGNDEGIASNILADRLQRLVDLGLVSRHPDPGHKQKIIYNLTEPAIELVPVLAQIGAWGVRHLAVSPELAIRARLLAEGGPPMWDEFMDDLRAEHLGIPGPAGSASVLDRLTAAYLAELDRVALGSRPDGPGGAATGFRAAAARHAGVLRSRRS